MAAIDNVKLREGTNIRTCGLRFHLSPDYLSWHLPPSGSPQWIPPRVSKR